MASKSAILLVLLSLNFYANSINQNHDLNLDQQEALDQQELIAYRDLLYDYFTDLMAQDEEMANLIEEHFGTNNPAVVKFLTQQIDPIGLAIITFKQHFTLEETRQIVAFHTSDTGRKFGNLFPLVLQDYKQALDLKIENLKIAITAIILKKEQADIEQIAEQEVIARS